MTTLADGYLLPAAAGDGRSSFLPSTEGARGGSGTRAAAAHELRDYVDVRSNGGQQSSVVEWSAESQAPMT